MATRQYGDFVVNGGHLHAGDTILNINIGGELTETANSCRIIDAALAKLLDAPTYLGEIRSDIEELLSAIENVQACIDENSINEALTSTGIQSNLLDLWMACRTHKQTLNDFEGAIEVSSSISPLPHGRTSHVQYAGLRGALRGLRRRLNTSIAILHLSTLQNMRMASEQHWSQLRRQIENLQELHESQTLTKLPKSLPISKTNLSRIELPEDPAFGIKRLLHTNPTTIRSTVPSMQLSSDYSSSLDQCETFISAVEYRSTTENDATSFSPQSSRRVQPFQRLLLSNARAIAVPQLTTFHARTASSSSWRRRPWMTPHVVSISYHPSDALLSLQRRLCDHGYSLLQSGPERQYRKELVNSPQVLKLLERVENSMLPVFAEVSQGDATSQSANESARVMRVPGISIYAKSAVSRRNDYRQPISESHFDRSLHFRKFTHPLDDSDLETIHERKLWPMNGVVLVQARVDVRISP